MTHRVPKENTKPIKKIRPGLKTKIISYLRLLLNKKKWIVLFLTIVLAYTGHLWKFFGYILWKTLEVGIYFFFPGLGNLQSEMEKLSKISESPLTADAFANFGAGASGGGATEL